MSANLTLHYKRVLYLLDPSEQAHQAGGKHVQVREHQDGTVRIFFDGVQLTARPFPKDNRVRQADIVSHKAEVGRIERSAEPARVAPSMQTQRAELGSMYMNATPPARTSTVPVETSRPLFMSTALIVRLVAGNENAPPTPRELVMSSARATAFDLSV